MRFIYQMDTICARGDLVPCRVGKTQRHTGADEGLRILSAAVCILPIGAIDQSELTVSGAGAYQLKL